MEEFTKFVTELKNVPKIYGTFLWKKVFFMPKSAVMQHLVRILSQSYTHLAHFVGGGLETKLFIFEPLTFVKKGFKNVSFKVQGEQFSAEFTSSKKGEFSSCNFHSEGKKYQEMCKNVIIRR